MSDATKTLVAPAWLPDMPEARGSDEALARASALQCQNEWSQWSGSNRRPAVYETAALPTELHWRSYAAMQIVAQRGRAVKLGAGAFRA